MKSVPKQNPATSRFPPPPPPPFAPSDIKGRNNTRALPTRVSPTSTSAVDNPCLNKTRLGGIIPADGAGQKVRPGCLLLSPGGALICLSSYIQPPSPPPSPFINVCQCLTGGMGRSLSGIARNWRGGGGGKRSRGTKEFDRSHKGPRFICHF